MKTFAGFEHGVNLGGWLSQCDHRKEHYETFITEEDFVRISAWGLDHVRVPVDYDLVETQEGMYRPEGFVILDRAYSWCRTHGLNMVLDLHKTFGYSFDVGEKEAGFFENKLLQERFYRLWETLAERFGAEHEHMAFELLNEVTDKAYSDTWNRIAVQCIGRVRKYAPLTPIIIGGYYNNSIEALPDLVRPDDDRIVYTFHCYEPLIFTHQGAYWVSGMDPSFRMPLQRATYRSMQEASAKYMSQVTVGFGSLDPDSRLTEAYFASHFQQAVQIAASRDVPLYCGEYGVIDLASPEDALMWYKMISKCFGQYHIGRSAWNYKEKDFGIVDPHMDPVRDVLVKLL